MNLSIFIDWETQGCNCNSVVKHPALHPTPTPQQYACCFSSAFRPPCPAHSACLIPAAADNTITSRTHRHAAPPTVAGVVQVLPGEAEDVVGDGTRVELYPEHHLALGGRLAVVALDEDVATQLEHHVRTEGRDGTGQLSAEQASDPRPWAERNNGQANTAAHDTVK